MSTSVTQQRARSRSRPTRRPTTTATASPTTTKSAMAPTLASTLAPPDQRRFGTEPQRIVGRRRHQQRNRSVAGHEPMRRLHLQPMPVLLAGPGKWHANTRLGPRWRGKCRRGLSGHEPMPVQLSTTVTSCDRCASHGILRPHGTGATMPTWVPALSPRQWPLLRQPCWSLLRLLSLAAANHNQRELWPSSTLMTVPVTASDAGPHRYNNVESSCAGSPMRLRGMR